jgi:1-aminocyclopropane-1-carboxylate deaminase
MANNLKQLLQAAPSPLQRLRSSQLEAAQVTCWVKRDDLLQLSVLGNPFAFSGNKWRKLQHNLIQAQREGKQRLLTFGGAFSNHIAAVAAAGHYFGFSTIGIIRGEAPAVYNPTLRYAKSCGMQLEFISRTQYREKTAPNFQSFLQQKYGTFYSIPEGGSNEMALLGSAALAKELLQQLPEVPDEIRLCCGTGGTAAGLIQGLAGESFVHGYSVLKGNFHHAAIQDFLKKKTAPHNWQIHTDAHCGGYAKTTPALLDFMEAFTNSFDIYLDPIYTGKLFFAFWQDLQAGKIAAGSQIVLLHSGGLQGIAGYNQRFGRAILVPPS